MAPVEHRGLAERHTVLIVEDDEAMRHSTTALLEMLGYEVITFATCEEFLDHVEGVENSCLLLDYHFDGLSGLGLLETLGERGISIPTVLYTGRFNAALRRRAADRPEIVAVIEKPAGGHAIVDAVARAFAAPSVPHS